MELADPGAFGMGGFQDTTLKRPPKRIIICCDGTWQSSVSNMTNVPSNVTRLARYLTKTGRDDKGQEWQQVVFYDAGIGTGVSDLEAKREGGTGSGFVGNVIEAYNFIVLNYNLGDQIFCLGFSRGAYTARAVAGLVTDIGIVQPRDMQDFPELYHLYQAHEDSHLFRKSQAWREWVEGVPLFDPNQRNVSKEWRQSPFAWEKRPHAAAPEASRWITAVGVFDTVGSLGIPQIVGWKGKIANPVLNYLGNHFVTVEKAGFHNVALSPYIKHAYHAMALDEHRKPFSPTLWHFLEDPAPRTESGEPSDQLRKNWEKLHKNDEATEAELSDAWEKLVDAEMAEELKGHRSELLQVWFPGVHINVGGGNDDILHDKKGDFEQIALITLSWMVERLKPHLSFEISFNILAVMDRFQLIRPAVNELNNHKKKDHWLLSQVDAIVAKEPETDLWNDGNKTRSMIAAVDVLKDWATGPIVDSFEGEMKEGGSLVRSPGDYGTRSPGQSRSFVLGPTNEQIHPTVQYRMEQLGAKYVPDALKGFTRQRRKDDKGQVGYEWVKDRIRIPEYKIGREIPNASAGEVRDATFDEFERWLVVTPSAIAFLGRLDKKYGFDSSAARSLDAPAKATTQEPENVGFQPNDDF